MSPLLGSSNGLILLRTSPGVWTQVYAVPDAFDGQSIYSFLASSPQCFAGYTGDFAARNSLDGGLTWTNTGVTYFAPAQFLLCIDEAGRIYAVNVDSLYRSTDFGASWSLAFSVPPGADTINDFALLGGYVWWEDTEPTGDSARLWRTDEEGNNPLSFTSADLVRTGNDSQVINRAFARLYQDNSPSDAAANGNVCCIDITDPDNPVFSLTEAPFGGNFPIYILPLAQDIAIAHTQTSDNSQGALWRTTDGGQTWTEVLSNDPSLGGPNGLNELCATLVVDPAGGSTVWAAGAPPTVWYSTDQGVTWTQETVGDANGASAWTGVGVGTSGPVPLLARSVQNLINRIDADLEAAGLPAYPWPDPTITPGVTIRAVQFVDMRTAIGVLYARKCLTLPDWTDGAPGGPSVGTAPTHLQTTHFTDLLDWLGTYESTPPPYANLASNLGVNAATYDPSSGNLPDATFAQDIASRGVQYVRIEVIADGATPAPAVINALNTWIGYLTAQALVPIVVLDQSTVRGDPNTEPLEPDPYAPQGPGGQVPRKNDYVDLFARTANSIASQLPQATIFEIWNEPDGDQEPVDADVFASLLNYCAQYMTLGTYPGDPHPLNPVATVQTICSGGILMQDSYGYHNDYVSDVYTDQTTAYWQSVYPGAFPWDRFGIHPYLTPESQGGQMVYWINQVAGATQGYGDPNPLWATEFGVARVGCTTVGVGCSGCENSNPATNDLDAATQTVDLLAQFGALVGQCMPSPVEVACWFKHEAYNQPPESPDWFGLTTFCYVDHALSLTNPPTQHWLAWSAMKGALVG